MNPQIFWRRWQIGQHLLSGLWAIAWFPLWSRSRQLTITKTWERQLSKHLALEITTTGTLHPDAAILIANHISWLDIPVLHSHYTDFFNQHRGGALANYWRFGGAYWRCAFYPRRGELERGYGRFASASCGWL